MMKVCVVTPWYPDRAHAFAGIFVKQQVDALRQFGVDVEVEVAMRHPAPAGQRLTGAFKSLDRLAERDAPAVFGEQSDVSFVPVLEAPAIGFAGRASAFERALHLKRRYRPIDADVVHAHVALPAGHAALQVDPHRPVVVTEHYTGLSRVLAQTDAGEMYRAVVERAGSFAFVSQSLRAVLLEHFADLESKVGLTSNIVDLREIPHRSRDEVGKSWLYVGTLTELKGVKLLLHSFSRYHVSHPHSTLTVVGQGPLHSWVDEFVERRSLQGAVSMVGGVPHGELGGYLDQADLLVHLSKLETFGISTMEAIGAGLPVINLDNGAAIEVWGEIEPAVGKILPVDAGEDEVCDAVEDLRRSTSLDPHAGRSFVEKRFSPGTVARQLIETYEGVL